MGERRVTADGRILEKMPDGSIVEVGRQGGPQPGAIPLGPRNRTQDRADAGEQRAVTDQQLQIERAARDRAEWAATHFPDGTPRPNNGSVQNVPPATLVGITGNISTLRGIDDAITALRANPNALGYGPGNIPFVGSRLDPKGVDARGKVAKVGGLQFHDLSGAAVTISEASRFRPFLPSPTDSPQEAMTKLQNLRGAIQSDTQTTIATFSPINNYAPIQLAPQDMEVLSAKTKPVDGGALSRVAASQQWTDPGLYDDSGRFVGEDPRFKGQRFNDNGQPDPNGDFNAYGQVIQSGLQQTIDEQGNVTNYEEATAFLGQPQDSLENGTNWLDKKGRTRGPDGSILSGWLGPMGSAGSYERVLKDQLQASGQSDPNSGTNLAKRFSNGAMFNLQDEASGLMGGLGWMLNGRSPTEGYQYVRDVERMRQKQNEQGQGGGGQVLGFLGSMTSAGALPGASSPGILNAARTGAAFGGLDGFGRGSGVTGSLLNAGGGAVGGGLGGALGAASGQYVIAPAARKLLNTQLGQAVTSRLGMSPVPNPTPTENAFGSTGADLAGVRSNVAEAEGLGLPYALPDADPRLRMFAGSVSRQSPEAYSTAEKFLRPRSLGQIDRLTDTIDNTLAPRVDVAARGKQLLEAGNTASSPYYQMAKGAQVNADDELKALLGTPSGQDALRRAQAVLQDRGVNPAQMGLNALPDGQIGANGANFETLDLVKRGFDARLNEARNPITGVLDLNGNPQLQAINDLRGRMVSRLDELNPAYPQARSTYAQFAQRKDALEAGYQMPGMLPRDAETVASRLTPDTLPEAQRGFATALGDKAEKLRYTANPFDAIYGSPAQQQRIGTMFPQGAGRFKQIYDREGDMAATAREVLGGSPTALRQGMDEAARGNLAMPAEIISSMNGLPGAGTATVKGAGWLARNRMQRNARNQADVLAPILFNETRNVNALKMLDEMLANSARRKAATDRASMASGLFGSALVPAAIN